MLAKRTTNPAWPSHHSVGRDGEGAIDFFDQLGTAFHGLLHWVFYRPAALCSRSRIADQSGASGGISTAIHGQFSASSWCSTR